MKKIFNFKKLSLMAIIIALPYLGFCQYFHTGGFQGGGHGSGGILSNIDIINHPCSELNFQAYPNPFLNQTRIQFSLGEQTKIKIEVYDVTNRLVKTIVNRLRMEAGDHLFEWQGDDQHGNPITRGIYFIRLETGSGILNKKIIRL